MGKVAVVTGGAKGIGRQIVIEMAKAGYDVAVNYHSRPKEAEEVCAAARKQGVRAEMFYADMGSVEDIRKMYREIEEVFPEIDVLVNNAGISSEVYFLDAAEEDFDRMTAIDWKGLYFSSQMAAKKMIEKGDRKSVV